MPHIIWLIIAAIATAWTFIVLWIECLKAHKKIKAYFYYGKLARDCERAKLNKYTGMKKEEN